MAQNPNNNQNVVMLGQHLIPPRQLPFLVRALWFLLVGWYAALLWISIAILFAVTIIGLPIATWMFDRTNAVMTLQMR